MDSVDFRGSNGAFFYEILVEICSGHLPRTFSRNNSIIFFLKWSLQRTSDLQAEPFDPTFTKENFFLDTLETFHDSFHEIFSCSSSAMAMFLVVSQTNSECFASDFMLLYCVS